MKMTFSKKMAVIVMIVYAIFAFVVLYLNAFHGASLEGVLGIVTPIPISIIGFYYSKAKAENIVRMGTDTQEGNTENSDEGMNKGV